ncbi:MAG: discoidin domain-containing protein [Acidimicrobiia bacterium]
MKLGGGGPDRMFEAYNPDWVDEQLDGIAALDFNTVRVFLDMCMQCTSTSSGIRDDYLDHLADLLTRIEAHGLVVLPTSNDVPDPGYSERLPCCEPFGGYRNSLYLTSQGHQIASQYWTDLITGLEQRGAPTHNILGWELANEQFVLRSVPPISLSEGTVTTADGKTYDLTDDSAVAEMVTSNLRSYITDVGDTVRSLDPGALVTMGFFSSDQPDAGRIANDDRWVVPDDILAESTLDFVDLHAYPGFGGRWDAIGAAFGLTGKTSDFPVILGEFGAFEEAYPDAEDGAAAMARWQAASCDHGFSGWLLWFWGADKDDEVIPVETNDAAIARAISPQIRPDPCDAGPYESSNFALDRPVTASAQENEEYGVANLVDGSDATWWSAGAEPPQWAEVDLEQDRTVARAEILIGHVSPPGPQTHRIWVRGADEDGPGTLAGEVTADAKSGDVLVVDFDPIPGVRYVRVETVSADGWVILHELRVFGPED